MSSPVSTISTSQGSPTAAPETAPAIPLNWMSNAVRLTPVIVQLAPKSFLLTCTLTPTDYQTHCGDLRDYSLWERENAAVERRLADHASMFESSEAPLTDTLFDSEKAAHHEAWLRHELLPGSFKEPVLSRRYLVANSGDHELFVYVLLPTTAEYAPPPAPLHRCSAGCRVCTSGIKYTARNCGFVHEKHDELYSLALPEIRRLEAMEFDMI